VTRSPREIESQLLELASERLLKADSIVRRIEAAEFNRKLWQTMAIDLADPGNSLPDVLRSQMLSIAGAVLRLCERCRSEAEAVESIVEINRSIARGLSGMPEGRDAA